MANKTKIQISVEVLAKAHNAFAEIRNDLKKLENLNINWGKTFDPINQKLKAGTQAAKEFEATLRRVANIKTTTANPYSQVFTKEQVGRLASGYQTGIDASVQGTYGNKFGSFLQATGMQIHEAKQAVIASNAWLKANKDLKGSIEEGLVRAVKNFRDENERMVAGMGKTRMSFLHLKQGIKGYIKGMTELLAIQARWYGARALLFAAVELPMRGIKANIELGQAIAKAGAAAEMTSAQMEEVRKQAIAVSREVPVAAQDVAGASFEFAQAGMDFKGLVEAMPLAAKMVTITKEPMETAVGALTTAFFAWKLEAKELPRAADMIAASMQSSRLKVADLATVFNYLATTARMLNKEMTSLGSLEETLTLVSVLSQAGVRPSTIGTGLTNSLVQLVKMPPKLKTQLKDAGIDPKSVDPTKNKLIDVFRALANAPELTLQHIFEGWEIRGGRSISALLNMGIKAIEEMQEKITQTGTLDKMFEKASKNIKDQLQLLQNEFTALFQFSGDTEQNMVEVIKFLKDLVPLIDDVKIGVIGVAGEIAKLFTGTIEGFYEVKFAIELGIKALRATLTTLQLAVNLFDWTNLLGPFHFIVRGISDIKKGKIPFLSDIKDFALNNKSVVPLTDWVIKNYTTGDSSNLGIPGNVQRMYSNEKWSFHPEKKIHPEGGQLGGGSGVETEKKGGARAYQNQLFNALRDGVRNRLAILRDEESEKKKLLDMGLKLGTKSQEEHFKEIVELAKEYEIKKLDEIQKLTVARQGLEKEYQADLARAKTSQQKELIKQRYENQLDQIKREESKIVKEAMQIRIDAEIEHTIWLRNENIKRAKDRFEIEKIHVENRLKLENLVREGAKRQGDYLYSKNLISAEEYYSKESISLEANRIAEITKLNMNLAEKRKIWREYEEQWGPKKEETIRAYEEYKKLVEVFESERLLIEQDFANQREDLRIKEMQDIKKIYSDEGILGVIKHSIIEIKAEWDNIGQSIKNVADSTFKGMGDAFKNLFTDIIKGELKSAEEYIIDFLNVVLEALAEFAAKQVASGILGAIFSMFSGGGGGGGGGSGAFSWADSWGQGFSFLNPRQRASGGYVGVNKAYLVGERGPELFVPGSSGSIVSNASLGGASSPPVTVVNNIINKTGSEVQTSEQQPQFDGKKWIKTIMIELANTDRTVRNKYGVR